MEPTDEPDAAKIDSTNHTSCNFCTQLEVKEPVGLHVPELAIWITQYESRSWFIIYLYVYLVYRLRTSCKAQICCNE